MASVDAISVANLPWVQERAGAEHCGEGSSHQAGCRAHRGQHFGEDSSHRTPCTLPTEGGMSYMIGVRQMHADAGAGRCANAGRVNSKGSSDAGAWVLQSTWMLISTARSPHEVAALQVHPLDNDRSSAW